MTFSGLFYAGYGAIITPAFGVQQAYGDDTVGYNNALGFFVLSEFSPTLSLSSPLETRVAAKKPKANHRDSLVWTVFNTFFLIASIPM